MKKKEPIVGVTVSGKDSKVTDNTFVNVGLEISGNRSQVSGNKHISTLMVDWTQSLWGKILIGIVSSIIFALLVWAWKKIFS